MTHITLWAPPTSKNGGLWSRIWLLCNSQNGVSFTHTYMGVKRNKSFVYHAFMAINQKLFDLHRSNWYQIKRIFILHQLIQSNVCKSQSKFASQSVFLIIRLKTRFLELYGASTPTKYFFFQKFFLILFEDNKWPKKIAKPKQSVNDDPP